MISFIKNVNRLYLLASVLMLAVIVICFSSIKSQLPNKSRDIDRQNLQGMERFGHGASSGSQMSENERRVARLAIKGTEDMRESGLLAQKPGVDYSLTNDEGEITNESMERAGIDLNRKSEVKAIIDRLWDDMSVEMRKRMVLDKESSNPEQGLRVYKIPADRSFAENRLNSFKEELRAHFGGAKSEILFDGLLDSTNHFGWFGKFDLNIRFVDADSTDPNFIKHVEFTGRDPKSGQIISEGGFSQEGNGLRGHFGSIFDHMGQ